jgi:hypothetical protein
MELQKLLQILSRHEPMELVFLLEPQPLEHDNQLRRLKDELRINPKLSVFLRPFDDRDKKRHQFTALALQISRLLRLNDTAFREQFQPVRRFFEFPKTSAVLSINSVRIYGQTQATKVLVETEAGDAVEQRGDDDIGNGVAVGQPFVPAERPEHFFRGFAHGIVIAYDEEQRFDGIEELYGQPVVRPVSEQGNGFADHVPRGTERDSVLFAEKKDVAGLFVMNVLRNERSEEKRDIAEGFPVRKVHGFFSAT